MTQTETIGHSTERASPQLRRSLVRLSVVAAILVFLACLSLLLWRGLTINVPDTVLIARAGPPWEGAVVTVDGINLPRAQSARFDTNSKYTISFHLVPGEYTIRVQREGRDLFVQDFALTRRDNIGVLYLPTTPESVAAPATRPSLPSIPFSPSTNWPGT